MPKPTKKMPPAKRPEKPPTTEAAPQGEAAERLQQLEAMYADGAEGDMSRLERTRQPVFRRVLFGLLAFFAVLAAVSWAGFFFFSPTDRKFSGEGVTVTAEGPAEIRSGEQVSYIIRWRNDEKVPLGTASLKLRLPREFELRQTDPAMQDDRWDLGSIGSGKEGSVRLDGVFLADKGTAMDLQAILSYHPADFNSEFQRVATKTVTAAGSLLELEAQGPTKVMPGDKVTVLFHYRNGSDRDFRGVTIKAQYPPNFLPESAQPAADDQTQSQWTLPTVAASTDGTIAVTGTFASDARGKVSIGAGISANDPDGRVLKQNDVAYDTEIIEGNLVTQLILNGSADSQTVNFGDVLRYSVTWRNTGSSVLTDNAFTVHLEATPAATADGQLLRWNDLKDTEEGTRKADAITWNKKQVTALERLAPGAEGTINFEIPLVQKPFENTVGQEYRITAWVEAAVGAIDGNKVDRTAKSQPVVAKVLSDAALACEARYFNDDGVPVGSGPLPPKVGESTVYRVFCTLTNSLHELSDLKLSAKLPANVIWTGKSNVDAGDLRFDAASEKLIWNLNWLPTTIKSIGLNFDAAITPTEDQAGKVPTFIDATILEATDKIAGAKLLLSIPPMTTALENDAQAEGKARVVK